ncbi:hypothetical protein HDU78_001165 [Chytriomyces hyalinus]|nr:hypothetical protein HDU78_001165 [Chytriomyces hyalinus]
MTTKARAPPLAFSLEDLAAQSSSIPAQLPGKPCQQADGLKFKYQRTMQTWLSNQYPSTVRPSCIILTLIKNLAAEEDYELICGTSQNGFLDTVYFYITPSPNSEAAVYRIVDALKQGGNWDQENNALLFNDNFFVNVSPHLTQKVRRLSASPKPARNVKPSSHSGSIKVIHTRSKSSSSPVSSSKRSKSSPSPPQPYQAANSAAQLTQPQHQSPISDTLQLPMNDFHPPELTNRDIESLKRTVELAEIFQHGIHTPIPPICTSSSRVCLLFLNIFPLQRAIESILASGWIGGTECDDLDCEHEVMAVPDLLTRFLANVCCFAIDPRKRDDLCGRGMCDKLYSGASFVGPDKSNLLFGFPADEFARVIAHALASKPGATIDTKMTGYWFTVPITQTGYMVKVGVVLV